MTISRMRSFEELQPDGPSVISTNGVVVAPLFQVNPATLQTRQLGMAWHQI